MLLEEFLRPLGLTQVAAADRMGIPLNRLNEIIKKKRGVSADTALLLAKLLGTSATFWMNLQATWDIYQATKRGHLDLAQVRPARETAVAVLQVEELEEQAGEEETVTWTLAGHSLSPLRALTGERVTIEETDAAADSQYALAA
jgi:addiction module HigA family antidote